MSRQLQPPVSFVKIEPLALAMIKNEPAESEIIEIGIDDVPESSDKQIISDIKDIDIVSHTLCEDSIKTEIILETKHSECAETQVLVEIEKTPFVKIENKSERENLIKTEDTSDDNGQEVIEVQDLNGINVRSRKSENRKKANFAKCFRAYESTLQKERKIKGIEAPVILVEPHKCTSLADVKHVCNYCQREYKKLKYVKQHIRKIHRKITTIKECPYCPYKSKWSVRAHITQKHKDIKDTQWFQCRLCEKSFKFKSARIRHMKVHLTHKQMPDRLELCMVCGKVFKEGSSLRRHIRFVHNKEKRNIERRKCQECEFTASKSNLLDHHIRSTHKKHEKRYHCDKCYYKTDYHTTLKIHKLIHLKPEEIPYFYCYHCTYKSHRKDALKSHISKHFRNEDVPFHCYICDFMTLKGDLIIEHFKKHSKHRSKCDETKYKYQLETLTKKPELRYCCGTCDYKTYKTTNLDRHKLKHLKPEEIPYFYCYHCAYQSKQKFVLKNHILRHFKKEEIKFHCYICDFVTLKRELIIDHIKKHSKDQIGNS